MKKIILYAASILAAMTSFMACEGDEETLSDLPQIFVEEPFYTLAKDSVNVVVKADVAPASDISIPIKFGGTAQKDFDFTVSDSIIVIKAGETEGSFTIKRVVENIGDDNKDLYVNLAAAPEGYSLGLMNYASVTLLSNNGVLMSFADGEAEVKMSGEVTVNLTSMKGGNYRVPTETTLNFIVDESSTAVEGEHFEFEGGEAQVVIPKNRYKGTFTINFLKKEEGHDLLVLRFADKDGYAVGNIGKIAIQINGPDFFGGTWSFVGWGGLSVIESYGVEDMSKAPQETSESKITFEGSDYTQYTFTPSLKGDLKNYFGTSSRTVTFIEETTKEYQEEFGAQHHVAVLSVPDVNVAFSATNSNVRTAKVSFRLMTSEGEQLLECTIDDWEPQGDDFGAVIYEYMWDMSWAPIRAFFKKD